MAMGKVSLSFEADSCRHNHLPANAKVAHQTVTRHSQLDSGALAGLAVLGLD
jgi:hypothetical protein